MTTILVIEDDADVREALALMLRDAGHDVLEAPNGVEALRLLDTVLVPPAVILLDLMMPRMDGWTFVNELRLRGDVDRFGIVVHSCYSDPPRIPEASARVRKPATAAAILAAVERCALERSAPLAAAARAT